MSNKFETRAIRAGERPDSNKDGDVAKPIHLSSTFARKEVDKFNYEYSRTGNPTREAFETKLASLENSKLGLGFASGMAATTTILLSLLKAGDHVVAFDDLYGGTSRMFNNVLTKFNVDFTYVDATNSENVKKAMKSNTKIIFMETPTNPMMRMCDIKAISKIAKEHNAVLVVDNTFMSPYFQQPLELGADISVYSTTKYLNGHSDSVGGALVTNNQELYDNLKFNQNNIGAILSPFDSYLVMRGMKTLAIRMDKHSENAMKLAVFLEEHSSVEKVYYPGLKSHLQHELAKKQMSGFGGMLSFTIKGGLKETKKFIENLHIFALAESLGGVESLIEIPSLMTHTAVSKEIREQNGITDNLIRVSVGIENVDDLIADLKQSFNSLK
ncbi:MAG: PLP-dependent aspartate aminotransferase family protein [archaeon]